MYAHDNDGWIIPGTLPSYAYWNNNPSRRSWFELLAHIGQYSPTSGYGLTWKDSFICPAETREPDAFSYTEYGVDTYVTGALNGSGEPYTYAGTGGNRQLVPRKFVNLPESPAQWILVMDNKMGDPYTNTYSLIYPSYIAFRHSGGANFLYADGHVGYMKETDKNIDSSGDLGKNSKLLNHPLAP